MDKRPRLQGIVKEVERTGEFMKDEDGNLWERCVFTLELTGFSRRTPEQSPPKELLGRRVRLVRYACFDWHLKLGVRKTLEPDETEAVLRGERTETVFW